MGKKAKKKTKRAVPTSKKKKRVAVRSTSKKVAKKRGPKTKKGKITEQQKAFCEEYLIDFNGSRACMKVSGCKTKASAAVLANKWLKLGVVQNYLASLRAKVTEETGITIAKVMDNIEGTRERAEADDDYSAELRACELQGKHVGAFEKDNIQRAFILEIG